MFYSIILIKYFVRHYLKSFRLHGIHSPFVFSIYNRVIKHTGNYRPFASIEKLRKQLINNNTYLKVADFGAGSKVINTKEKKISQIARTSANPPRIAQFLFRLINLQKPTTILEIGTSLGLTTAYLASARTSTQVFTLEGCAATAHLAQNNFAKLKLNNVNLITGNFENTLPEILKNINKVDFVLFDGNHRYAPTLRYFEWCLTKKTEETIFVFDDIYWSGEMLKAWKIICAHPEVMISIDLFYLGLVFFRKNQPKQHFTIRL